MTDSSSERSGNAFRARRLVWRFSLGAALAAAACREPPVAGPVPAPSGGLAPAPPSALGPNAAGAAAPHPVATLPVPEPDFLPPSPRDLEQEPSPSGGEGGSSGREPRLPRGTAL